ncbi:oxytocin receptor-like [Branchiostoma floridae x Branchiostoma japonicum]
MGDEDLDISPPWEPITFNYSGNATNETLPLLTRPGERDETLAAVEVGVLGALFFLALTGNSYVLADIYRSRTHHRRMHLFLANLCIADLTVALFNILPQLIWDATDRFLAGDFLCRVVKYLQLTSLYASSFVLVGSALDRYTAICHPMSAVTRTVYKPKRVLLLCWSFSVVFGVPQIQIFGLRDGPHGYPDCWGLFIHPWGQTAYVIWCSLSLFFIPCLIIATAYTHISIEVWRVYREEKSPGQLQYRRASRFDVPIRSGKFRPRTHRVGGDFRATKIRTVQMTLVIVIAYILCWSPFFIMQLWAVFDLNAPFEGSAFVIIMLLASLNSCVNPWIYFAFKTRCDRKKTPRGSSFNRRAIQTPRTTELEMNKIEKSLPAFERVKVTFGVNKDGQQGVKITFNTKAAGKENFRLARIPETEMLDLKSDSPSRIMSEGEVETRNRQRRRENGRVVSFIGSNSL